MNTNDNDGASDADDPVQTRMANKHKDRLPVALTKDITREASERKPGSSQA